MKTLGKVLLIVCAMFAATLAPPGDADAWVSTSNYRDCDPGSNQQDVLSYSYQSATYRSSSTQRFAGNSCYSVSVSIWEDAAVLCVGAWWLGYDSGGALAFKSATMNDRHHNSCTNHNWNGNSFGSSTTVLFGD